MAAPVDVGSASGSTAAAGSITPVFGTPFAVAPSANGVNQASAEALTRIAINLQDQERIPALCVALLSENWQNNKKIHPTVEQFSPGARFSEKAGPALQFATTAPSERPGMGAQCRAAGCPNPTSTGTATESAGTVRFHFLYFACVL